MSDFSYEVGELQLFNDQAGDHKLSGGQSFTITKIESYEAWRSKNPNKPLNYHATKLVGNKVSFFIGYHSFNGDFYEGCEKFIENHLIKFGILRN